MGNGRIDLNSDEVLGLVSAAKLGDRYAMTQLVILLSPIVRAQVKRVFIPAEVEPDDLYQEGMFGVLDAVKSYDASRGASFLTYVNICIRSKLLTAVKNSLSAIPLDNGTSLERTADSDEVSLYELVDYMNSKLSKKELDTLRLFLSGYTYEQIADKFGTTVKSVDGTLQRARKKLKNYRD